MTLHKDASTKAKTSFQTLKQRLDKTHGTTYSYYNVVFIAMNKRVLITCKLHGDFGQRMSCHLSGRNCPRCVSQSKGLTKVMCQSDFIKKCKNLHGNSFNYVSTKYTGTRNQIEILCNTCSTHFSQRASDHVAPRTATNANLGGCPKCSSTNKASRQLKSTEKFIADARDLYTGKPVDYSEVEYTGAHSPVKLGCVIHGTFQMLATDHLKGHGCQKCATSGFNKGKPACLYFIHIVKDCKDYWKVGITNRSVYDRYCKTDRALFKAVAYVWFKNGAEAATTEKKLIRENVYAKYVGPSILVSGGNTELFTKDILHEKRNNQNTVRMAVSQ